MRSKTTGFRQVFVLGLATACLCFTLCGCGKVSPHSERRLVAFVEEIDEDATLDYESREPVFDAFRDLTDYRYDAKIGGIDCYVVDRYYRNFDLPFSDYYKITTDYTYRLCELLWDDLRVDYPCINSFENKLDGIQPLQGLAGEPYEMNGHLVPDCVTVYAHEDVIDEEVFDDYWNFYCDLTDAMKEYPEFARLQVSVYEGDTSRHFTFNGIDSDEYDKEYESYFGQ